MALFINEREVNELLDMPSCLAAVEEAFRQRGEGEAMNLPRRRLRLPRRLFHLMPASLPRMGYLGYKAYGAAQGQDVVLYSVTDGLVAIIRSGRLGQMRTGAASGIATKYMAREDAARAGCFGAGYQAETQLLAVAAVRKLDSVRVYSRDAERRRRFAAKMTPLLGLEVRPAGSPEEAVKGSDILITITTAREPVFDGNLLEPGTHVNAAGANLIIRREVDEITVTRSGTIAVDDIDQAKLECGDLLWPIERGLISWEKVHDVARIVAGLTPGRRSPEEITLFESQGIALEDVAAAAVVYERARERGLGTPLPF